MDSQSDGVVNVYENVAPGYLYDIATKTFSPSKDAEYIKAEDMPFTVSFDLWSKERLDSLCKQNIFKEDAWMKDYVSAKSVDAVMVKGVRILERKGIDVPLDNVKHCVTSLYYKYHADLLVLFKMNVSEHYLKQFEKYLLDVVTNNSNVNFFPDIIWKHYDCAYIYPTHGKAGKKIFTIMYGANEFCRLLKETPVSTVPVCVFIQAPRPSYACLASIKSRGALGCDGDSKSVNLGNIGMSSRSVNTSIDGVPQVHSKANVKKEVHDKENCTVENGRGHGRKTKVANSEFGSTNMTVAGRGRGTMNGRGFSSGGVASFIGKDLLNSAGSVSRSTIQKSNEDKCLGEYECNPQSKVLNDHRGSSKTMSVTTVNECQKTKEIVVSKDVQHCEMNKQNTVGNTYNLRSNSEYNHNSQYFNCATSAKVTLSTSNTIQMVVQGLADSMRESSNIQVSKLVTEVSSSFMPGSYEEKCNSSREGKQNDLGEAAQQALHERITDETIAYNQNGTQEKVGDIDRSNRSRISMTGEENSPEHMSAENPLKETESDSHYGLITENGDKKECNDENPGAYAITIEIEAKIQGKDTLDTIIKRESGNLFEMDSKQDFQKTHESKHKGAKASNSITSSTEKQKQLWRGIGCEETDELSVLQVPKQSICDAKNKNKPKKKKLIQMKSTLLTPEKNVYDSCGLERKYYGIINDTCPEKIIIFLGASGSGKTMLINFIANYFMGKKTADDDLIHVETTSPTYAITAYTFCSSLDENPITIIDTPGLNDSSGAEVRDHVQSLKTFLANASSKGLEIHAIGFVAQAYLVRLTSSERLVMDYVSTMFGQSVSEHLMTLVTFADNQDTPPVVEAMKNYGVNSKLFLKFNNSALSNSNLDEIDDLDRAYWRVCWRNWKKCLKTMRGLPALGVNTMKAVQSEVYATTVIESAERDLLAELKTFFTYCRRENCMSKDALQVCEKIWELGAIVHRLRHVQNTTSYTLANIITESSLEACKVLSISPDKYVSKLSLNPSGPLVVSGSEIIRTMAYFYKFAKRWHFNSETISKSTTEWAYCHGCEKEHKMKRYESTGVKKYIPGIGPRIDVLTLQCEQCKCPGETHGVSSIKSPLHLSNILRNTQSCLRKALNQFWLPGFPVEEKLFFELLNHHFNFEHQEFIEDLLRMPK